MGQQYSSYDSYGDSAGSAEAVVTAMSSDGLVETASPKGKLILVIDADSKRNWAKIFEGALDPDNLPVRVEQAAWGDVHATAYSSGKLYVTLAPSRRPIPDTNQHKLRVCQPSFLLIRNGPLELHNDYKNHIFAFQYAQIPSVNSLESIYNTMHRPWVFAQLIKIRNRLGKDKFPLIEQMYYSDHTDMMGTPGFPVVLKVSHAHGGYGKVKCDNHHDFEDLRNLVALHKSDYSTTEPFLNGEYDLRIQKIGDHYRMFKRQSISGNWKTNTGTAVLEELPITDYYKLWVDECAKMFGGLDILAVDAIHTTDGKEFILEVNDGSIGLAPDREPEDNLHIREIVMRRLLDHYKAQ